MANAEVNLLDVPEDDKLVLVDTEDELEEAEAEKPEAEAEKPEAEAEKPEAEAEKPRAEAEKPRAEEPRPRRHKKTRDDRIAELTYRFKSEQEQRVAAETRLELRERELLAQQAKFLQEREDELTKVKDEAIRSGDMESYDTVNTKLDELRRMEGYGAPTDVPEQKPEVEQAPPANLAPAAAAWIDDNSWFKDPKNAELARKAIMLEEELAQKYGTRGFRVYRELDEMLEADPDFTDIYGVDHDTELAGDDRRGEGAEPPKPKEEEKPRAQARPVRGGDRGETPPNTPNTGKDKNGLTDHDKVVMRRFNLDDKDPKVIAAYLKRKGK